MLRLLRFCSFVYIFWINICQADNHIEDSDRDTVYDYYIEFYTGCTTNDGSFVENGTSYLPRPEQCITCTCNDGRPDECGKMECHPELMPCLDVTRVLGECCKFTCEPRPTTPALIPGQMYIQQIGSYGAIVQWKIPAQYQEIKVNLTVYFNDGTTDGQYPISLHIGSRPYAILRDLDPNTMYSVMVNGTIGYYTGFMTTEPESFSLDGRGRNSLVLNDALGEVHETRPYYTSDSYQPVVLISDRKVVINLDSFHRVEVSMYNGLPCYDQECGQLSFYMYTAERTPSMSIT